VGSPAGQVRLAPPEGGLGALAERSKARLVEAREELAGVVARLEEEL